MSGNGAGGAGAGGSADEPAQCDASDPTNNGSNPINAATGNKFQHETDYVGGGPNPLRFARFYNSQAAYLGSVGSHWRHTYDRSAEITAAANEVRLHRADGRLFLFVQDGAAWRSSPDVTLRLERAGDEWLVTDEFEVSERYSAAGLLLSVTALGGAPTTLHYDAMDRLVEVDDGYGRKLVLTYDANGRVGSLQDPAAGRFQYAYDGSGNLIQVTYPDMSARSYQYEAPGFPHALTAVVDESGRIAGRWQYDDDGRATSYERADGVGRVSLVYHDDGTTTVDDAQGGTREFRFVLLHGALRTESIDGDPCTICGDQVERQEFDANGFTSRSVDLNGVETVYVRDLRGLETLRIEAAGTPVERRIETEWHPTLRRPARVIEPGRETIHTYDAAGRRTAATVVDTATGDARTTRYSYRSDGLLLAVDGPRTDVSDVSTYEYDAFGNVSSFTNAAGHVTTFEYNAHGDVTQITDPNGVVTSRQYDGRRRLLRTTVADATLEFTYDALGRMARLSVPSGAAVNYVHDASGRLIATVDSVGNRLEYTLDASGNRLAEHVSGPGGATGRQSMQLFDHLSRLVEVRGGEGQVSTFEYDAVGNATLATDSEGNSFSTQYDALRRVIAQTDALQGVIRYEYDPLGRLREVRDARNVTTTYSYNAFGDIARVNSPDSGESIYHYDEAGNRVDQRDARGVTSEYEYDSLNRLTSVRYPDHPGSDILYTWDTGDFGVGRISRIDDETGSIEFRRDTHGRPIGLISTVLGTTLTVSRRYDESGNLISVVYPDGREILYHRDSADRVTGITLVQTNGLGVTLATDIQWEPLGSVSALTFGNEIRSVRTYDRAGRTTRISTTPLHDLELEWGVTDNLASIIDHMDSARAQVFTYDGLDRLTRADGIYGAHEYRYDPNGNRTSVIENETVTEFIFDSQSNRLTSIDGVAVQYDPAGNMLSDGRRQLTFDARNRMAGLDEHSYGYNALGYRVFKPRMGIVCDASGNGAITEEDIIILQRALHGNIPHTVEMDCNRDGVVDQRDTSAIAVQIGLYKNRGAGRRSTPDLNPEQVGWILFVHDESGRLIGEYDEFGRVIRQYVWLESMPIAVLTAGDALYLHTDHLHAPMVATDGAGTIVWRADRLPFGETFETVVDVEVNLRLPGQYVDRESGVHSNVQREYLPELGRFTQTDPIGLADGPNPYVYVANNPIRWVDPLGLAKLCCRLLDSFIGGLYRKQHCYMVADDGTTFGLYPAYGLPVGVGLPDTGYAEDVGGVCTTCTARRCEDQNECLRRAYENYPVSFYFAGGTNSNTFVGSLARQCCAEGVPDHILSAPGINRQPPPSPPPIREIIRAIPRFIPTVPR